MSYVLSDDAKKVMNEIYREFVRSMDLATCCMSEEEAIRGLKKLQARGYFKIEVDLENERMRIVPTLPTARPDPLEPGLAKFLASL